MNLYKELRDNLSEGMRFYLQLQEVIGTLVQHCGDYCLTRRIQRDDLLEELRRQVTPSGLSNMMCNDFFHGHSVVVVWTKIMSRPY
jgi:hypothetical protein